MTQEVSELLKKALALPAEARAALAGSLLESLDDTVDLRRRRMAPRNQTQNPGTGFRQGKAHPLGGSAQASLSYH
jgi:hypothetical protein